MIRYTLSSVCKRWQHFVLFERNVLGILGIQMKQNPFIYCAYTVDILSILTRT